MADDQVAGQALADLTQIEKQLADAKESQEILYAEYVRALKGKQNTLAERLKNDWMMAEATVAQFEQTVKDYKNRIEARTDTKVLAERFRQRLDRVRGGIARGDVTWREKRDALEAVGTKVFASGSDADIYFEVFPSDQWAALSQPRSIPSAEPTHESARSRRPS
jgi:septal ring factor EnvC (AmiA/AmiB activator)